MLDATFEIKRKTERQRSIEYRREEVVRGVRKIDEVRSWRVSEQPNILLSIGASLKID